MAEVPATPGLVGRGAAVAAVLAAGVPDAPETVAPFGAGAVMIGAVPPSTRRLPATQPAHEEFPLDWSAPPVQGIEYQRAVFIASRRPIANPVLSFVAAFASPGTVVKQEFGRTDDFWYGMAYVAYTY